MSHDINNDPLKELESALSVRPSPEFAARVRERVRQEPARASWGWWSLAAASVAIALIGVGSVTFMGLVFKPARVAQTPAAIVAAGSEDPALHSAVPVIGARVAGSEDPALLREKSPTPSRPAVVHASARSDEPEVLVPRFNAAALNRFLSEQASGRLDARSLTEEPALPVITIEAIRITTITIGSGQGGEGGR